MKNSDSISVSGVIIAGGKGRRLQGQDKGLVTIAGKTLTEHVIERLQPQVDALMINANRNLSTYQAYGFPVISDELSDYQGPLAGFATAMSAAQGDYILTAPCDGPLLPANLRKRLQTAVQVNNKPIAVAFAAERLQPVYALIDRQLLPGLREFLSTGQRKIDRWFAAAGMVSVDFSDQPNAFLNVNTAEDQDRIEQILR